jgi:hypothetical protein
MLLCGARLPQGASPKLLDGARLKHSNTEWPGDRMPLSEAILARKQQITAELTTS